MQYIQLKLNFICFLCLLNFSYFQANSSQAISFEELKELQTTVKKVKSRNILDSILRQSSARSRTRTTTTLIDFLNNPEIYVESIEYRIDFEIYTNAILCLLKQNLADTKKLRTTSFASIPFEIIFDFVKSGHEAIRLMNQEGMQQKIQRLSNLNEESLETEINEDHDLQALIENAQNVFYFINFIHYVHGGNTDNPKHEKYADCLNIFYNIKPTTNEDTKTIKDNFTDVWCYSGYGLSPFIYGKIKKQTELFRNIHELENKPINSINAHQMNKQFPVKTILAFLKNIFSYESNISHYFTFESFLLRIGRRLDSQQYKIDEFIQTKSQIFNQINKIHSCSKEEIKRALQEQFQTQEEDEHYIDRMTEALFLKNNFHRTTLGEYKLNEFTPTQIMYLNQSQSTFTGIEEKQFRGKEQKAEKINSITDSELIKLRPYVAINFVETLQSEFNLTAEDFHKPIDIVDLIKKEESTITEAEIALATLQSQIQEQLLNLKNVVQNILELILIENKNQFIEYKKTLDENEKSIEEISSHIQFNEVKILEQEVRTLIDECRQKMEEIEKTPETPVTEDSNLGKIVGGISIGFVTVGGIVIAIVTSLKKDNNDDEDFDAKDEMSTVTSEDSLADKYSDFDDSNKSEDKDLDMPEISEDV